MGNEVTGPRQLGHSSVSLSDAELESPLRCRRLARADSTDAEARGWHGFGCAAAAAVKSKAHRAVHPSGITRLSRSPEARGRDIAKENCAPAARGSRRRGGANGGFAGRDLGLCFTGEGPAEWPRILQARGRSGVERASSLPRSCVGFVFFGSPGGYR